MRERGRGTLNAEMKVGETFDRRGEIFGVFGTKEGVPPLGNSTGA